MESDSICIILFRDGMLKDKPHMVIATVELAKEYCKIYPDIQKESTK